MVARVIAHKVYAVILDGKTKNTMVFEKYPTAT